jgi:hypothetical protein
MRALALAALLMAVGLAGCSDDGGGDGAEAGAGMGSGGMHGAHDAATHILAPAWEVGQWWALASEQASGPFTHVVSGEKGEDWVLDTDSPDIAFFDARFDISFLGSVRKSDLAGSQGSQRVEFFQFPLTEGKNWTTTWDGLPMTLEVASVAGGKAAIEARHANGTLYADYTYDAKTGYFGEYTFYAPDGETAGFAAKVTSSGKGFSGDLVRWGLAVLYESSGPLTPGARSFEVGPGLTDVWASVDLGCDTGAVTLNFGPFTGPAEERGFSANGPCPLALSEQFTISAPAAEEAWGVQEGATPTTQSALDLTILARTQTLFKAGAAP